MNMTTAVKTVFSKYATFSGRARRSEYWYFVLFNAIVGFVLGIIGGFIFGDGTNYLTSIYSLAVVVPAIAVSVRRLHDIGKSGFWYFINFIPFVGTIIMIVFCATDSQPGDNQYGPNPKMYF